MADGSEALSQQIIVADGLTLNVLNALLQRFQGANLEMLARVLIPYRLRIEAIWQEKEEGKRCRVGHYLFRAPVDDDLWADLSPGVTGKVVPQAHVLGNAPWQELVKGRVLRWEGNNIIGEFYFASHLEEALKRVHTGDFLEIDAFGINSKVESALSESAFAQLARARGFEVERMPENVAMHLGTQNYFDFLLKKLGRPYRSELKSLWGTDTSKARLIHTASRRGTEGTGGKNSAREDRQHWHISTCRFNDQDFFAVNLWLRTGRIDSFAFALSVSDKECPKWGLPCSEEFPEHVIQNPVIPDPPDGRVWTTSLEEICERVDAWKEKQVTA